MLRGGPGAGKSALLRFAREQSLGMAVLEARAARSESAIAGAALSQLLPDLDGADPSRCATTVRRAAAGAPLLLLVDDAQWLDATSIVVLAFVARRLRGAGIAMLIAARDEGEPEFELPHDRVMTLPGLDLAAASALLPPALPRAVLESLRAQTTGNPLALQDLSGVLAAAQLGGTEPLPDPLPLGPRLLRELAARFEPLSALQRRALVIAAAYEGGDLELLARALHGRGLGLAALEEAEAAGIVTIALGRLSFADPLLRSAAYHCAAPASRRDAHAALAAVLGATDAAQRARHLMAAALGPSERIARALDGAAGDVRGTPAAAGRALEAAARLTPDRGRRTERLLGAARAHHRAGDPASALDALDRALAGTQAPRLRADVQRTRAQVEGMRRPLRETRAALIAEADRVSPFDRARAAALLVEAASLAVASGEPRESLRLAELATAAAERAEGSTALMASLLLGAARILCGESATGCPLLERARPLLRAPEPSVFGAAGSLLAVAMLWVERFEESRTMQIDVIRRVRAEGDVMALPYALQGLALAEYLCGDWRAAAAVAQESLDLAGSARQPVLVCLPHVALGLVAGGEGRIKDAREHLAAALDIASALGIGSIRPLAGWALGLVELGAGNHEEAIAALEPAGRIALECGLAEPGVAPWAQELAEAYIRVGRRQEAEATLAILERQAAHTGRRLAHAGAARCRGLLADGHGLDADFARALGWQAAVACPLERARTELCHGERLRRVGRRSEARAPLRRALVILETLGAEPWAERARRELGATGERARRRTPDTLDQLTPQELRVARLVAEGATNRETAARLFVKPKTVETHLGNAYRKLGVRSRVELARHLAAGPGGLTPP